MRHRTSVKIKISLITIRSALPHIQNSFSTTFLWRHLLRPDRSCTFFPQTQEDPTRRRSLSCTDKQPWAPWCGAASQTSSPTRPPSLWWSRAGLWASSTGSYSCSSSLILSGQWCLFACFVGNFLLSVHPRPLWNCAVKERLKAFIKLSNSRTAERRTQILYWSTSNTTMYKYSFKVKGLNSKL